MGQYYKPIILGTNRKTIKGFFYSHSYGNGLKLMEHSYLNNNFVRAVVNYLKDNGGANLVWAGDYADDEPYTITKKISRDDAMKVWQKKVSEGTTLLSFEKFYASKDKSLFIENKENGENLYHLADSLEDENGKTIRRAKAEIKPDDEKDGAEVRFIINESKKQYIDLWYVRGLDMLIHPLPLLTAEGNNRGGGDYFGTNMSLVGSWARDFISVRTSENGPWEFKKEADKKGWKEISPLFIEHYTIKQALDRVVECYNILKEENNLSDHDVANIKDSIKALRDIVKKEKEVAEAKVEVEVTEQAAEPALAEA
jgi:hypothetical protein